tara:strand:- start:275 stop:1393 length:1119 start_codon:yes stop_codon:yes gene_type:complete
MYPSLAGLPVGTLVNENEHGEDTDAFLREEVRRVSIAAFKTMAPAVANDIIHLRLLLESEKEGSTPPPKKFSTVAVLEHQKIQHVVQEDIFVDSAIELRLVPHDVPNGTKVHIEATVRFRAWLKDTPKPIENTEILTFTFDDLKSNLYFILYPDATTQSGLSTEIDADVQGLILRYQQLVDTQDKPGKTMYHLDTNDYFQTFCKRGVQASDLLAENRIQPGSRSGKPHEKDDLGFLDAFLDESQKSVLAGKKFVHHTAQAVLFCSSPKGDRTLFDGLQDLPYRGKIQTLFNLKSTGLIDQTIMYQDSQASPFVNLALSDTVFYKVLCDAYQRCLMNYLSFVQAHFEFHPDSQTAQEVLFRLTSEQSRKRHHP